MTPLLETVIERIASLPAEKQNSLASFLLAELESENRWDALFTGSSDMLTKMADEALAEFERGETELLNLKRDFPSN